MVETLGAIRPSEMVRSERGNGLKILHIVPSYYPAHAYGGPVYATDALCRGLSRRGASVRVLTTNANGPKAVLDVEADRELESEDGVRIKYCSRNAGDAFSVSLLRSLKSYLRWADVVHLTAVYSFPTLPTLSAAKSLNKPVVWSPRGSLQPWSGGRMKVAKQIWNTACRLSMPHGAMLHFTSEEEAEQSRAAFPGLRPAIVPNGVDVPVKSKTTWHPRKLPILFLGRIDTKKAIENLINACSMLSGVDWTLSLAGGGDNTYGDRLKALVRTHRLEERIRFLGPVLGERKEQLFEEHDALVLPSHGENFGMAIAEALAYGMPVIASKGAPWSRVEEKDCGLWSDNSPAGLADAITRISRMPLAEMGSRGRLWMQSEFSWTARAEAMSDVYRTATTHN